MATQTSKDKLWKDEAGHSIPFNRLTKAEKDKETISAGLLKKAIKVNEGLIVYKNEIKKACEDVFNQAMQDLDVKPDYKGNFTWYNFDRSIKVETSISDRIDFDDLTIQASKHLLDEFLNDTLDAKTEFVKELVIDAFSTTKGKLDAKKVLGLLKYKERIKIEKFQEALSLIEKAIRRPDSKSYHRIYTRNDEGKYSAIELNFSNI